MVLDRSMRAPFGARHNVVLGGAATKLSRCRAIGLTTKPKYVNIADLNGRHQHNPAGKPRPAASGRTCARTGVEPYFDLIELVVLRLSRLRRRSRRGAGDARLRPRASSRVAFRQPQSRHEGCRPARRSQDHQAVARPRAQAADRRGLCGAEGGRQRSPAAAALCQPGRRGAGDEARRTADRAHFPRARRARSRRARGGAAFSRRHDRRRRIAIMCCA